MSTRRLHEVVFPDGIEALALYWETDLSIPSPRPERATETGLPATGAPGGGTVLGRRRVLVPASTRASTATYFNAFPASYWWRWTLVREVRLTVQTRGEGGSVTVYRSTPDGHAHQVQSARLTAGAGGLGQAVFVLPLDSFGDGGWYWFDLIAGDEDLLLEEAWYEAAVPDRMTARTATISITTFNRPRWCLDLLEQLAEAIAEVPEIDEVLVVDQGVDLVEDVDGYERVAARLGERLNVIRQANLGGAGGFARGMSEATRRSRSDYVLLLDDDVQIERESIRRALTFADLCARPTIVGGHMLSMYARSSLHSFGEVVDRRRFWWGPAESVQENHDFSVESLQATAWLHRRVDVEFNGWWMCLIPVEILQRVGFALPVFIKWDDAEFGLRAGEAGFPTVSLPGVAVWHVPWTDKNDALDWQAYFHQRNRFVVALLHSPFERGGYLLLDSVAHQMKYILSMRYSTAELRLRALEDVLAGPAHLHSLPAMILDEIRDIRRDHPDANARPDPGDFPAPIASRVSRRVVDSTRARGLVGMVVAALLGSLRQLIPVPEEARRHPQALLSAGDAQWWRLSGLDSAVVSTRDGTAFAWHQRNQRTALHLALRTVRIHHRFRRDWPALAEAYRHAAPALTSPDAWEATFDRSGQP